MMLYQVGLAIQLLVSLAHYTTGQKHLCVFLNVSRITVVETNGIEITDSLTCLEVHQLGNDLIIGLPRVRSSVVYMVPFEKDEVN